MVDPEDAFRDGEPIPLAEPEGEAGVICRPAGKCLRPKTDAAVFDAGRAGLCSEWWSWLSV
jgi:hypothetical protein